MANSPQQRKRVRTAQRQRLENLRFKSAIKTHFRKLKDTITAGNADDANEVARTLASTIDKAAAHKAIHKNNAARKKSKMSRMLGQLSS